MAPEQARGQVGLVDERCDVFGLGAILCEILTGQPPYAGPSAHEALGQARQGDLAGALARLDCCGADAELVGLARESLAAAPEGRPRDAGVVAGRVAAYLAGVQERLRAAEVERAAAQAKAAEAAAKAAAERRARRLTVGLAAAGLALVVLAGGGGLWLVQRQAATAAAVQAALERAWQLQAEGKRAEAEAAARQAEALLAESWGHADLRRRVREVRADIDMAGTLEGIRLQKAELTEGGRSHDPREIDRAYATAFRDYGLPVEDLTAEEAAEHLRRRAIAVPLALALDDWALQRRSRPQGESAGWRHLFEVARRADPDEWRDRFRAALLADDPRALPKLAAEAKSRELPAPTWLLLATAVQQAGSVKASVALLQVSEHQHPDDFWTHLQLGELALTEMKPPLLDKAVRHYSVARALRPGNPVVLCNLGKALLEKGLPEVAIPILTVEGRLRLRGVAGSVGPGQTARGGKGSVPPTVGRGRRATETDRRPSSSRPMRVCR
jgi:serine/threonine-protein kinase